MQAMYYDILLEKGELYYLHSNGPWVYALKSDAEAGAIGIVIVKASKVTTQ